jgi:hypothetical protein
LSTVIEADGIKVSALNDGEVHLPPMFYPGLDFGAHPELLQADGTYHIPVGCFLIQEEDLAVLVDTDLGPSSIRSPAILPLRPGSPIAGVDYRGRSAAWRAGRSRCRAGGYHHRLPHPFARRPYRVGRPRWCSVLSQRGGHVRCRRVGNAAHRPRAW